MKVFIDPEKCQGHNRCLAYSETMFDADEMGFAHVVGGPDVPEAEIEAVKSAEENCPERAIRIKP